MIKSGGHRIFPAEVEDAISRMPGVAEVAVVGMPDEVLYERPVAVIVSSAGEDSVNEAGVLAHCAGLLPPHKRPARVILIDSLPKTSSGKIQRSRVRETIDEKAKSNIAR
jgi:fatty-acyl-CoA synthase